MFLWKEGGKIARFKDHQHSVTNLTSEIKPHFLVNHTLVIFHSLQPIRESHLAINLTGIQSSFIICRSQKTLGVNPALGFQKSKSKGISSCRGGRQDCEAPLNTEARLKCDKCENTLVFRTLMFEHTNAIHMTT